MVEGPRVNATQGRRCLRTGKLYTVMVRKACVREFGCRVHAWIQFSSTFLVSQTKCWGIISPKSITFSFCTVNDPFIICSRHDWVRLSQISIPTLRSPQCTSCVPKYQWDFDWWSTWTFGLRWVAFPLCYQISWYITLFKYPRRSKAVNRLSTAVSRAIGVSECVCTTWYGVRVACHGHNQNSIDDQWISE